MVPGAGDEHTSAVSQLQKQGWWTQGLKVRSSVPGHSRASSNLWCVSIAEEVGLVTSIRDAELLQNVLPHPGRFPTDAPGSAFVRAKVCSNRGCEGSCRVRRGIGFLWLRRLLRVYGVPVSVGATRDPGPRDCLAVGPYLIFLFWRAVDDRSRASTAMATITNDLDNGLTTLSVFHGPQDPPLLDLTLADFLDYQCLHFGNDEAIVTPWDGTRWKYHDLQQHSIYLARYLLDQGIKAGDRVAILAGNRVEYASVFFACMRIGVILVILNNTYTTAEAQYALQYTGKFIL